MKTKELATDELLKIATPRPWSHSEGFKDNGGDPSTLKGYRTRDIHGAQIEKFGHILCGYAIARVRFDQVKEPEAEANAELLCRAVNSFEAMREAINGLMRHCVTVKGFPDKDKGRTEEQQRAYDAAKNALALAEGKAVQS